MPAVIAASLPMFVIGIGHGGVPARHRTRRCRRCRGSSMHGWTFEASFALPLARQRPDRRRRHRALSRQPRCRRAAPHPDRRLHRRAGGVRLCAEDRHPAGRSACSAARSNCRGRSKRVLQAIVLLPAFGLPYAVAVRHVFSPRTVLRRSLQYAFARRTLDGAGRAADRRAGRVARAAARSVAVDDRRGRPLFYLFFLAMLGLGLQVSRRARSGGSISASSATSTTRARSWCRWPAACRTKPIRATWSRWS